MLANLVYAKPQRLAVNLFMVKVLLIKATLCCLLSHAQPGLLCLQKPLHPSELLAAAVQVERQLHAACEEGLVLQNPLPSLFRLLDYQTTTFYS